MSELTKQQLAALVDVAKKNPEWALQQAFRFGLAALSDGSTQAAIERASEIFECDAEDLKSACMTFGSWDNSAAKEDYDERKKIARELRAMIAGASKEG